MFLHSWDDWVTQDRLRKNTEENRELAINLKKASQEQSQPKPRLSVLPSKSRKRAGSDLDSGRGSIARDSSVSGPAGRGTKRGRDLDIEKVSAHQRVLIDHWNQFTTGPDWPVLHQGQSASAR